MNCTLCGSSTEVSEIWRENKYHRCNGCKSILLNPKYYINELEEKTRYEQHNNDVEDKNYQDFVSPIVDSVLKDYNKDHIGLDFGSGTGPVISKLLRDNEYNIKEYDPFFANYPRRLKDKYDYLVCCEVVEHFHNPLSEFKLMKSLLKPGGSIYIMTNIYSDDIDFTSWSYKNDKTHVFFYHKEALKWIKTNIRFSSLEMSDNLIKFTI